MPDQAIKNDVDKARLDLVPIDALLAVGRVLTFGAKKYRPWNWIEGEGFSWSRLYGATQRHLLAWFNGDDVDPETNESHLAHAATNLFFLITYRARGLGEDDRPRYERSPCTKINLAVSDKHVQLDVRCLVCRREVMSACRRVEGGWLISGCPTCEGRDVG